MLRCPVDPSHKMVEIAEDLFQCPDCGAGPGLYWALSSVEVIGTSVDAQCILYRPDLLAYVVTYQHWLITDAGRRLADSLSSHMLGHLIEEKEQASAALPHTADPPRKLVLKTRMFPSPLGPKPYGRKAGQRGTSGGAPSPAGSAGRFPPRRRKAGT